MPLRKRTKEKDDSNSDLSLSPPVSEDDLKKQNVHLKDEVKGLKSKEVRRVIPRVLHHITALLETLNIRDEKIPILSWNTM